MVRLMRFCLIIVCGIALSATDAGVSLAQDASQRASSPLPSLGKPRAVRLLGAEPMTALPETLPADQAPPELPSSPQPTLVPVPAPAAPNSALIDPAPAPQPAARNPSEPPPRVAAPPQTREDKPVAIAGPRTTAPIKIENSAEVSVEIAPGSTLPIGSHVSFRVTSKKPGYLILIDIDAEGQLTQIYPSTTLLMRNFKPNGNFIKPGVPLLIPSATDPYSAIQYVVSPPAGQAMVVAVLSEQPVQVLDMPENAANARDRAETLAFVAKWANELKIPDRSSAKLLQAKFSFDSKEYKIQ